MRLQLVRVAAAVLALASLGATPTESISVIERYADALATLPRPENMIFEFSVEQSGLHNLDEKHRVYRRGVHERDETLAVGGVKLKVPLVRIAPDNAYKYDVLTLAPKPAEYTFVYAGLRVVNGRNVYAFHAQPALTGPFAASDVLIDAVRFLPVVIAFNSAGGGLKAKGRVTFGPQGTYWVAREASVTATGRVKDARERIVWSHYRFPETLPDSTFSAPRPVATALQP